MSENKVIAIIVGSGLGIMVLLWLGITSIHVVEVGDIGVVTGFGQVKREVNSGVQLTAPWPFEDIAVFDAKTQKDQSDAAASSQDLQDVKITVVTNYHLNSAKIDELYRTVGVDYKARLIDPAIQESLKAASAQFGVSDIIVRRTDLKDKALALLKQRLEPRGIVIEDISLVNITFSDQFTKAIEQKQVAQQAAEQAQFELQKAQLDAQAQEVQKASLSPELLEKYAIDKWNGIMPTYVGGGSIFNIPLSK